MTRTGSSFHRQKPKYLPQKTVLILCEDSKSGKNYLQDACKYFRATAEVEVTHCKNTDPLGIVKEAIARSTMYDEVYCAIDRDRHPSFTDAKALAAKHEKVKVSVSFPCFEYWYLLHFEYTARPYTERGKKSPAEALIRDLCKKEGFVDYDKGANVSRFHQLVGQPLEQARRFAKVSRVDAERRGNPNPSTEVDQLIDVIEKLGTLQSR